MSTAVKTSPNPVVDKPGRGCCRSCGAALKTTFIDLGLSPLCESFTPADQLDAGETFYPLHTYVCESCWLVQLNEYVSPEHIFTEYAYFSSFSQSWLDHGERYTKTMIERFSLGPASLAVEIASNDGYLLQHFVKRGVPVLGVEPAANVAKAAEEKGVRTVVKFFGVQTAKQLAGQGFRADLMMGNNVLAQVPDLNDFVAGFPIVLKPTGVATFEFPHLATLVELNQFDTIYHEHFSYFSLRTCERLFGRHGMEIFDVEQIPTHGGSLRLYVRHKGGPHGPISERLLRLRAEEQTKGMETLAYYARFRERVEKIRRDTLSLLISLKEQGKSVVGYGAPGKGNTFLNYVGIRPDLLAYTTDRNPYKHGRFLPGTRIPIFPPEQIKQTRPDYVMILPWNLKDEIVAQNSFIREWGGKFITAIPSVTVF